MLAVRDLSASYGSVPVLNGISFAIAAGEVLALLGRNGVGKTTMLRTLMGLVRARGGEVTLDGAGLGRLATHEIARLGMAMVPQGRGIFAKLTVAENMFAGAQAAGNRPPLPTEQAFAAFPALKERLGERAGALSGGQQQQLALARAMVGRPKVLLLDEPSEGVQPNIVAGIGELIAGLSREGGVSVLLVEQNIELALQAASRCLVMEKGRIVHEGPADEFRNDAVLKRYLAL